MDLLEARVIGCNASTRRCSSWVHPRSRSCWAATQTDWHGWKGFSPSVPHTRRMSVLARGSRSCRAASSDVAGRVHRRVGARVRSPTAAEVLPVLAPPAGERGVERPIGHGDLPGRDRRAPSSRSATRRSRVMRRSRVVDQSRAGTSSAVIGDRRDRTHAEHGPCADLVAGIAATGNPERSRTGVRGTHDHRAPRLSAQVIRRPGRRAPPVRRRACRRRWR